MATYTTVTIRPTSTQRLFGWTITGASANAALSDSSDTTYLSQGASGESLTDQVMADPTIPAGAKIYGVRSNIRVTETTNSPFQSTPANWVGIGQRVDVGSAIYVVWDYINAHPASPTTYSFAFRTQRPYGGEWTVADVNALIGVVDVYQQTPALAWRAYEIYFDVAYNQIPVVTVTAPTEGGTVTDSTRPTVSWTYADPEGDPQEAFQVKIFSAAQYGAVGFDPTTSAATYDSGKVYSSATSHTPTVDLASGTTYRAYVRAWQPWQYEFYSAWDLNQFTVSLDLPAPPTVTSSADATNARIAVTVQGADNLLTANQASIETDTTGWAAGTNATIVRTTSQAAHGVASLRMDSVAAGDMSAYTSVRAPVVAGQVYTVLASFRSAVIPRSARVSIDWYTALSGGSLVSQSFGTTVTTITTGWTQATLTATAPAGATAAVVLVRVLATSAAAEVHYADKIQIAPGTSTTWTRGGLAPGTSYLVQYSDDAGVTWTTHPRLGGAYADAATQLLTGYDYEVPSGTSRIYRAYTTYTGPPQLTSAVSGSTVGTSITLTRWWLKAPQAPALNMQLDVLAPFDLEYEEPQTEYSPLGRAYPVVVAGTLRGERGSLDLEFLTEADWLAFKALRDAQRVLLLQDPFGRQRYLRLGKTLSAKLAYADAATRYRQVSIGYVEQSVP